MASFRATRETILFAHNQNFLNDEEFLLLYDLNRSKNPDFPYWKYPVFDLDGLDESECLANFRFNKSDIYDLKELLGIQDEINCYNRTKVDGVEALCVFLKRFSYPIRYGDMIPMFGRPVPELSIISYNILNHIYANYNRLFTGFNHPWLSRVALQSYANIIHDKGAALDFCWGFVDGTVRPVCRPNQNQRILYNGHQRVLSNGVLSNFKVWLFQMVL